ncbi:MAG: C39 family peptidase [Candidatus Sericytochromatia bacterium]
MPNLNDRFTRMWDQTTHLMGGSEARNSFLQQADGNSDGKVTGAEIHKLADSNRDGQLDSDELQSLALKADASEFDRSTLKAMAQAARSQPQLVLFEAQKPAPVSLKDPKADPVAPPASAPKLSVDPAVLSGDEITGGTPDAPSDATGVSATAPAETPEAPPAPPPLPEWKAASGLEGLQDSYRTSIAYSLKPALPSREPAALTGIKAGLLQVQEQEGNSCGTTSLSMLLKFYQGHSLENTVTTIDSYIRSQGTLELNLPGGKTKSVNLDGYTAARDIVDYASTHGMRAGMKNHASLSDIKGYLDKGVPVMTLTDWNFEGGTRSAPADAKPDGKSVHWVNIIGYEYTQNAETAKDEMVLLIANPHGLVQKVNERDFDAIWRNVELEIPGGKRLQTGMDRLLVTMVPRDDNFEIVAPNGQVSRAAEIAIPTGNDGIKGWLAEQGSMLMKKAGDLQTQTQARSEQLGQELANGYEKSGVGGALRNLWSGDAQNLEQLGKRARQGGVSAKAQVIQTLLASPVNRDAMQQLTIDLIRETPARERGALFDLLDTRKLASRLQDDPEAGQVMVWLAQAEVAQLDKTGPKFEAYATTLLGDNRPKAISAFVNNPTTVQNKLVERVPPSLIRDAVRKLGSGLIVSPAERSAISSLLKATSPSQFDQISAGLDMARVSAGAQSESELSVLLGRVLSQGLRTGSWGNTSEVLNHLGSLGVYTQADNVIGQVLSQPAFKGQLDKLPTHLRTRMIDLLDDVTRVRSDEALKVLQQLRALR